MYPLTNSKPSSTTPSLLWSYLHRRVGEVPMVTQDVKARAEIYYGTETCREKLMLLLRNVGLPNGLLTIDGIEEYGYVKDTGFVWLKRKKEKDYYKFQNVLVCYETEITAYLQPNKIKNLTGVKAREFLIWITLSEICVHNNTNRSASITFKTSSGLSKTFPLSFFQYETAQEEVMEVDEATNQGGKGAQRW
ncbi:hypothetical protein K2173_017449 [Erythroxylum novogranatense]|uniref:Uncharacterized protein n=1 Tax=Erythroxylum novogranatense TaxID=1862640 RepID=A0AAV8TME2_9ROSI|nr:hypothetical protein K2173_017449 [Erythroxylum novogranatense]